MVSRINVQGLLKQPVAFLKGRFVQAAQCGACRRIGNSLRGGRDTRLLRGGLHAVEDLAPIHDGGCIAGVPVTRVLGNEFHQQVVSLLRAAGTAQGRQSEDGGLVQRVARQNLIELHDHGFIDVGLIRAQTALRRFRNGAQSCGREEEPGVDVVGIGIYGALKMILRGGGLSQVIGIDTEFDFGNGSALGTGGDGEAGGNGDTDRKRG